MHAGGAGEPTLIDELVTTQKVAVVAVAAGIAHTCFLTDAGAVLVTGMNNFGQLGLGAHACTSVNVPAPMLVSTIQGAARISHISCGGAHTLLVDEEGALFASGSNSCGQVGGFCYTANPLLFFTLNVSPPLHFLPGSFSFCNNNAKLGLGTLSDVSEFVRVGIQQGSAGLESEEDLSRVHFATVCAGEEFSAATTRDRCCYTWGLGIAGQLGGFERNALFGYRLYLL